MFNDNNIPIALLYQTYITNSNVCYYTFKSNIYNNFVLQFQNSVNVSHDKDELFTHKFENGNEEYLFNIRALNVYVLVHTEID